MLETMDTCVLSVQSKDSFTYYNGSNQVIYNDSPVLPLICIAISLNYKQPEKKIEEVKIKINI